jgi:hypothetical protein
MSFYIKVNKDRYALGIDVLKEQKKIKINLVFFSLCFEKATYKQLYEYLVPMDDVVKLDDSHLLSADGAFYDAVGEELVDFFYKRLAKTELIVKKSEYKDFTLNNMQVSYTPSEKGDDYIEVSSSIVFDSELLNKGKLKEHSDNYIKAHQKRWDEFEKFYASLKWYEKLFLKKQYDWIEEKAIDKN